jgi:thiamine-phosphate pyrophosphorylase
VSRAAEVAQRLACGQGADAVTPFHLLCGLLAEEEGRAADLAQSAGLGLAAFRATWPTPAEELIDEVATSASCRAAIDLAHELAVDLTGERTLSSEPLLIALLRIDSELAADLGQFGLSLPRLEASVQAVKPPAPLLEETIHLADLTEHIDTARILDAGFNRAREALRIIEDYCRFALDDAFLTATAKSLRHDLVAAVEELAPPGLLESRETQHDVGTSLSTESEGERSSLADVVRVNLKRLQEALRSLEEFGKVASPLLGERLEGLRYRAYTLERAAVLTGRWQYDLRDARLYVLLSGAGCAAALDWTIAEAAAGGATVFQLREKGLADRELIARARQVREWTRRVGALFIVNDRPDIARLAEAEGVHLGQDDLPVKEARRILGPDALIGVSTHTLEQVRQAVLDGASYIGVGPAFPSRTKTFETLAGIEFVRAAVKETSLPAFAIGGINTRTIDAVVAAGARRVAVSHAVAQADEPRAAAAQLLAALGHSHRPAD